MALREINFIPEEIQNRRMMLRHLWLWGGLLSLFLVFIWGYYFYQVLVVLPQKRPITTVADMQMHLGVTIEEINNTEREIERLNLQESFLKRFTRNQPFSMLLLELSRTLNQQTWLTRLDIDTAREEGDTIFRGIRLYGYSFSNDELGDFLTQLSGQAPFRQIVLKFANETQITSSDGKGKDRIKVIQFQIDGNIMGS
ncbi:MAG: PilN domain-containing protein [Desulfobacterales bacterium]|nr:PilN domain-containing protein [Desulfobacterales bacterium]MDX2510891.1 PilN domain-containing protein [Desulfobacterales bacterium]